MRQHHRVRLRVRRAGHPHDRLADGVVHGEAGEPDGVAGQHRAERQRRAVRRLGAEAAGDQLGRPQRRHARRPGSPAACRAPRSRARARSSRSRRGPASAATPSAPGRRSRAPAAPAGTRRRRPACGGSGVISAPERVVGIAAHAQAVRAGDRLRRVDHAAAAERDQRPSVRRRRAPRPPPRRPGPAARASTPSAASTSAGAARPRARWSAARSRRSRGPRAARRLGERASPKRISRSPSTPGEVARLRPRSGLGSAGSAAAADARERVRQRAQVGARRRLERVGRDALAGGRAARRARRSTETSPSASVSAVTAATWYSFSTRGDAGRGVDRLEQRVDGAVAGALARSRSRRRASCTSTFAIGGAPDSSCSSNDARL